MQTESGFSEEASRTEACDGFRPALTHDIWRSGFKMSGLPAILSHRFISGRVP